MVVRYRRFGTNFGSQFEGALEGGTDSLSRNVKNYHFALRSIPQERKPKITQSLHHVRTSLVVMTVRQGMFHGLYQTDDTAIRLVYYDHFH